MTHRAPLHLLLCATLALLAASQGGCGEAPPSDAPAPPDLAAPAPDGGAPPDAAAPADVVEVLAGVAATGFVDGAGTAARFSGPAGGVALPDGSALLIADTFNAVLRRVSLPGGAVETVAGRVQVQATADGVGRAARFQSPRAMVVDRAGARVYLADGPTIRRVSLPGFEVVTLAGTAGMAGYADGTGAAVRLGFLLHSLELSADERTLYIVDRSNRVLRALDLDSGAVRTVAGAPYGGAAQSADGTGAAARFGGPGGVTRVGEALYVADTFAHTVRRVSLSDFAVTTVVGAAGAAGLADGVGAAARLRAPQGLVHKDGALYSVSFDGVLRRVDLRDLSVKTLLGDAEDARAVDGVGAAARLGLGFAQPMIATDGDALWYQDRSASSLRRIDLKTLAVTTLAGAPEPEADHDGPLPAARFRSPRALAASADGQRWFVADDAAHVIRLIDRRSGRVETLAGQPGAEGADDGPLARARFSSPAALAWDEAAEVLYVADGGNATLRVVDLRARAVRTLAGSPGATGTSDGEGAAARFLQPTALALDGPGAALYVAESTDRGPDPAGRAALRRVSLPAGAVQTLTGGPRAEVPADGPLDRATFADPAALALDLAGRRLFVAERELSLLRVVDLRAGTVTRLAGKAGESGPADGTFDEARFDAPGGLAFSAGEGALYVSDAGGHTIRRLDLAARRSATWLGDPSLIGGLAAPRSFRDATLYFPAAPVIAGGALGYIGETAIYLARPAVAVAP